MNMPSSKFLPASFLVLALIGTAAAVATAQEAPAAATDTIASDARIVPVDMRGGPGRGGPGGAIRAILAKVDTDKNGSITQEEVDAFRAAQLAAADTSADSAISLAEFQTVYLDLMRGQMVDAFQELDEDGDGSVTKAELDARFGGIVAEMDRNGDGALSAADRGKDGHRGHRGDRGDRGDREQSE